MKLKLYHVITSDKPATKIAARNISAAAKSFLRTLEQSARYEIYNDRLISIKLDGNSTAVSDYVISAVY